MPARKYHYRCKDCGKYLTVKGGHRGSVGPRFACDTGGCVSFGQGYKLVDGEMVIIPRFGRKHKKKCPRCKSLLRSNGRKKGVRYFYCDNSTCPENGKSLALENKVLRIARRRKHDYHCPKCRSFLQVNRFTTFVECPNDECDVGSSVWIIDYEPTLIRPCKVDGTYLLAWPESNLVKFGRGVNFRRRMATYYTHCPVLPRLVCVFRDEVEKEMHVLFAGERVIRDGHKSEFFRLSDNLLNFTKSRCYDYSGHLPDSIVDHFGVNRPKYINLASVKDF